MKIINKKHDLINIQILDKAEITIPKLGLVKLHDAETQSSIWIDTNNKSFQNIFPNNFRKNNDSIKKFCKNNKIDFISIDTSEGYLNPLEQFFNSRIHRF
jgi:hypothetical protein